MGEDFYAIIKLVSGEEIMSLVMPDENDGDPILILQNPIIMKMHQNPHGHYIKVKPWIELTDEDFHMIKLDKIITMTETQDERIIEVYKRYIKDQSEPEPMEVYKPNGAVKPNAKMGYISSVQEARLKLENIFNSKPTES